MLPFDFLVALEPELFARNLFSAESVVFRARIRFGWVPEENSMSRFQPRAPERYLIAELASILVAGTAGLCIANPALAGDNSASAIAAEQAAPIFGFGADTEDRMITRDLTVKKPEPFYDSEQDTSMVLGFSAGASDSNLNLSALRSQPLFSATPTSSGLEDDSFVISAGAQKISSVKVCAGDVLTEAFVSLQDKLTDCAMNHIKSADQLEHKDGTMILVADRGIELDLKIGKLKVAEGSVLLITKTAKGAAIYNFHDRGKNSVVLELPDHAINVSPGRHVHATHEKAKDFESINELDIIAHRRLSSSATASGVTIYTSEFSTLSALEAVPPLKQVLTLKHPEARKLANQMIKTSAVLMHLGGGEDFKHHIKPRMAALVDTGAQNQ